VRRLKNLFFTCNKSSGLIVGILTRDIKIYCKLEVKVSHIFKILRKELFFLFFRESASWKQNSTQRSFTEDNFKGDSREKVRSRRINLEGNTHAQEINVSQLPV
jgi:hypothetical protein